MKNPWVIAGVVVGLLLLGGILYSGEAAEKYNEGVIPSTNIKGNKEASVKLVEYSDFECPACANFQPALNDIMAEYGDELSLEYKHFPLVLANPRTHLDSMSAALASEAAGQQGKFFEYHDLLFLNQREWSTAMSPTAIFVKYAEQLELDIDKFRSHMKSSLLSEKVEADFADGVELGITGTPSFFINGERMEFTTYEEFINLIVSAIDPASSTSTPEAGSEPTVRFGL